MSLYTPLNWSFSLVASLRSAPSTCCTIFSAFTASSLLNPSIFTASRIFPAISLTSNLDGGFNGPVAFGAGVSAGCCVGALSFDLDRAGGSAGTAGGVAEELRPLAVLLGAGATTTASGSGGLDPVLSFFSALPTDVVGGASVSCGGVWGIKKGRSALPRVVIGVRVFDFCAERI